MGRKGRKGGIGRKGRIEVPFRRSEAFAAPGFRGSVGSLFFTMFFSLCFISLQAQPDYLLLRNGDLLYQAKDYSEAETMYRKALEEKQKPASSYNLGNSVYQQNRMDEAAQSYKQSIAGAKDPLLKSNAYFNLGNTYFQQKDYGESIKAYKEALKLQPKDEEAKKNLMLAMRQLQQQQQQQQQNQQQQQQQQEQEKDKQDQQQQNQQQQQQNQQQNKESKENEKNEPVSKDEAREILKAIEREDQKVQEKLKKETGTNGKPVKDW